MSSGLVERAQMVGADLVDIGHAARAPFDAELRKAALGLV
jgi:hypothetical protein